MLPNAVRYHALLPAITSDTSPTPEDRARIVGALDSLRRQEEAILVNKPRFMLHAYRNGLTYAEIAELLGMSVDGVRRAIKRADGTPGMEIGAAS